MTWARATIVLYRGSRSRAQSSAPDDCSCCPSLCCCCSSSCCCCSSSSSSSAVSPPFLASARALLHNFLHSRASARQLLGLNLEAAHRARPIRLEPLLDASCQPPASPAALGQISSHEPRVLQATGPVPRARQLALLAPLTSVRTSRGERGDGAGGGGRGRGAGNWSCTTRDDG